MKAAINVSPGPAIINPATKSPERSDQAYVKGLSHELRTPLNVIVGLCELLNRDRQTPLSEMHRDAVMRMERNARVLLHSVNELLDYLRDHPLE